MIEVYSKSLTTGAGDTIVFNTTSEMTNSNIALSNGVFTLRAPGRYMLSFNGIFSATTAGTAQVQLYDGTTPIEKAIAQSTVTEGGLCNMSFTSVVRVLPAPSGESAKVSIVNSLAGTWALAHIVIARLP